MALPSATPALLLMQAGRCRALLAAGGCKRVRASAVAAPRAAHRARSGSSRADRRTRAALSAAAARQHAAQPVGGRPCAAARRAPENVFVEARAEGGGQLVAEVAEVQRRQRAADRRRYLRQHAAERGHKVRLVAHLRARRAALAHPQRPARGPSDGTTDAGAGSRSSLRKRAVGAGQRGGQGAGAGPRRLQRRPGHARHRGQRRVQARLGAQHQHRQARRHRALERVLLLRHADLRARARPLAPRSRVTAALAPGRAWRRGRRSRAGATGRAPGRPGAGPASWRRCARARRPSRGSTRRSR